MFNIPFRKWIQDESWCFLALLESHHFHWSSDCVHWSTQWLHLWSRRKPRTSLRMKIAPGVCQTSWPWPSRCPPWCPLGLAAMHIARACNPGNLGPPMSLRGTPHTTCSTLSAPGTLCPDQGPLWHRGCDGSPTVPEQGTNVDTRKWITVILMKSMYCT